jgi:hypothetical protein
MSKNFLAVRPPDPLHKREGRGGWEVPRKGREGKEERGRRGKVRGGSRRR